MIAAAFCLSAMVGLLVTSSSGRTGAVVRENPTAAKALALTVHDPIWIVGNAGLVFGNGVTSGSGSQADPYIIEGWQIDAISNDGIKISGTTAYLVIRNVIIDGGNSSKSAISLSYCSNVSISGSTMSNAGDGINITFSRDIVVVENQLSHCRSDGIWIVSSSRISVFQNDILSNNWAPFHECPCGVNIEDPYGPQTRSDNITVGGNVIEDNLGGAIGIGWWENDTSDILVFSNTLTGNEDGVWTWGTRRLTISGNLIEDNQWGVWLERTRDAKVCSNNIINNGLQGYDDRAADNHWNDSYPTGGNYWSDYAGLDEYNGPLQDVLGSDGIGDTPYSIDSDSLDCYPLMERCNPAVVHELRVDLSVPARVIPNGSALLRTTITNEGTFLERNISVSLSIEGSVVNDTVLALLSPQSPLVVDYTWVPMNEGLYNVTASVIVLPGESNIGDNHESKFVRVTNQPPVINIDTGLRYATIQAAVDAPETLSGHTIIAETYTYHGQLVIGKSINIIGEDETMTVIDGDQATDFIVRISASNVTLANFSIRNGTPASTIAINISSSGSVIDNVTIADVEGGIYSWHTSDNCIRNVTIAAGTYGIHFVGVTGTVLCDNSISGNNVGIYLEGSSSNRIVRNEASDSSECGISLREGSSGNEVRLNELTGDSVGVEVYNGSDSNSLLDNIVSASANVGIYIQGRTTGWPLYLEWRTSSNIVSGNHITSCGLSGLQMFLGDSNTVFNNYICENQYGVALTYKSSNNNIVGNNVSENSFIGILIDQWCVGNTVSGNTVSHNGWNGISLSNAASVNTIVGNNITFNHGSGMYLSSSIGGHTIYHNNIFGNNINATLDAMTPWNIWDNGYPSGGNYWGDYTGQDANGDGIGDTPYPLNSNNQDGFPLMGPWGLPSPNTAPSASFEISPTSGDVNTVFAFDASSSTDAQDPTSALEVRWDFNDDGIWDVDWTTEKSANWQYSEPGTYTVRLEVRDTQGLTNTTTMQVEVVEVIPEFSAVVMPIASALFLVPVIAKVRLGRRRP